MVIGFYERMAKLNDDNILEYYDKIYGNPSYSRELPLVIEILEARRLMFGQESILV